MSTTTTNRPPEGWGETRDGRPTFTVHGQSFTVTPPAKPGWHPHFIARHGTVYTTWSYRPNTDSCGCSDEFKSRGQR